MGTSYVELLKDPRWQRRRLEILQRDDWTCQRCGDERRTLHVHHRRYIRGALPWEYQDSDLITLCEPCHELETDEARALKDLLAIAPPGGINRVRGYVEAFIASMLDRAINTDQGTDFVSGVADAMGVRVDVIERLGPFNPNEFFVQRFESLSHRDGHVSRSRDALLSALGTDE